MDQSRQTRNLVAELMVDQASSLRPVLRRWTPTLLVAAGGLALSLFGFVVGGPHSPTAMAGLVLGLLITGVLASITDRERRRRLEIETAVAARTAELNRQIAERERAEARFRDFAEIASDWLWETDTEFHYTFVSANVAQGSGSPASYYLGKARGDPATLGVDAATAREFMKDMEARRPFRNQVSERRRADGTLWYGRTSGNPVYAADGSFVGYRGTSTDVTAEVKARREADAAHQRLIEALEIMPAGVMIYDSDDRLVLANARMREMFPNGAAMFEPGTTRQQQLEFAIARGVVPAARERPETWLRERMASFRSAPEAMLFGFADGRWFQHLGRRSATGGAISVFVDVTGLKRTEEELQAAKRRSDETLALLDTLQSAAPIGLAYLDPAFRFVRVNEALAVAIGRRAVDLVGSAVEEALATLWPQVGPVLRRVLESETPVVNVEVSGKAPGRPGDERHWLATFYPVRVQGSVTGIGVVAFDVSGQRRVEAQLRQAQKMDAIGSLTGGVAHDFNNLLGVVIGNLDLLLEGGHDDVEAKELAGDARDAALRGADLTRRLLAFARRQPLRPRQVDVNELVAGTTKMLGRLLGESIEVTLDLVDAPWPVVVDAAQLEVALTNLATNARDAMPAGGSLRIATRNCALDATYTAQHPYVKPGDFVLIEVTDTGTGMPPEVLSRVFEPFFTTKPQGKGTGLGLSMVFGFMKQSGGHINVYSELGIGTTFRLYFPRAEGGEMTEASHDEESLPRGRNEVVLVVEDNVALRKMAVRQIAELGYRVREAQHAQEALEAIARDPGVELVFTDVVMPGGMDGRQLADIVTTRWPQIKVLLTSGFPGSMVGGLDRSAGVSLLSKPYRRDQLARAMRDVLDRDQSGPAPGPGTTPKRGG
jgi:PAS domain S-box-containing protein